MPTLAYPAPSKSSDPTGSQPAVRIARHSACDLCHECSGLHPAADVTVVLDGGPSSMDGLELFGDKGPFESYLETCDCGHDVTSHGADQSILEPEEFKRRGRVALRLDELLMDADKLLDFSYEDEDIISLRRQMKAFTGKPMSNGAGKHASGAPASPISSVLSDLDEQPSERPSKKRRISLSSDEEELPLAVAHKTRPPPPSEQLRKPGTGRKVPAGKAPIGKSNKSKSSTAPANKAPLNDSEIEAMNAATNGTNGYVPKVKTEDRMDESQLDRLATGVTVDTAGRMSPNPPNKEKPSALELRRGIIKVTPIENDRQPRSLVILTGLKTLFQKQLPKMPREYIARLVYDSNSRSLAIIKRGYKVVGGICFRPFPHRGFAEIVFFATHSVDQVKGYGALLMDHFKAHIKGTYPNMMHFLTYADNYAVGYFEKQGFTKDITLDRSVWAGYIKDYEGGTIMQCTMVRQVDYLAKRELFTKQTEAILTKIRALSKAHIVYEGLPQFQDGAPEDVTVDYKEVPGLKDSGWSPSMEKEMSRLKPRNPDHFFMEKTLRELMDHPLAWPYIHPVSLEDAPDYYQVITKPMDLKTVERKLTGGEYSGVDGFAADVSLVFENAKAYNPPNSSYFRHANQLDRILKGKLSERELHG